MRRLLLKMHPGRRVFTFFAAVHIAVGPFEEIADRIAVAQIETRKAHGSRKTAGVSLFPVVQLDICLEPAEKVLVGIGA